MQENSREHKLAGPKMQGANELAKGNHIGQIVQPRSGASRAGQIVNREKQAGKAKGNEKEESRPAKAKGGDDADAVCRDFGWMDVL